MTHLSLFSGIGGLDLAAEMAGFTSIGQCEWADYPTKILEKHWPDVPRWRDIRALTGDDFYAKTGLRTVDIISGGFPCQPFSVAGKRRGTDDDRYLWPEMLRVIFETRPTWVLGENVPGIVNLALDQVLTDLEAQGYACQTFNIPACGIDAPHKRARICIIGCRARDVENSGRVGCGESDILPQQPGRTEFERNGEIVANANEPGLQGQHDHGTPVKTGTIEANAWAESCSTFSNADNGRRPMRRDGKFSSAPETQNGWCNLGGRAPEHVAGQWWPAEPGVGRVAHGIPSRVDRLKCLGNAVVPAQFYPFFKYIAELLQP